MNRIYNKTPGMPVMAPAYQVQDTKPFSAEMSRKGAQVLHKPQARKQMGSQYLMHNKSFQHIGMGSTPQIALPSDTQSHVESGFRPYRRCNCKNSRCLKLYCECFASRRYCIDCNCIGCANTINNKKEVDTAVAITLERNPSAFKAKITIGKHTRGCHCRKSGCLKRYCECYQAGIVCGDNCKCIDCKNYKGSESRKRSLEARRASPVRRRRTRSKSATPHFGTYTVAPGHTPSKQISYPTSIMDINVPRSSLATGTVPDHYNSQQIPPNSRNAMYMQTPMPVSGSVVGQYGYPDQNTAAVAQNRNASLARSSLLYLASASLGQHPNSVMQPNARSDGGSKPHPTAATTTSPGGTFQASSSSAFSCSPSAKKRRIEK
eukprot:TRINITY_DN907_c0_g1_i2.p1 TRINITY_DN907_c0_g1~~TRINITY_DN907_c0_g1_i2.p1  ORF type:complete len:412 (-),score=27.24 TRINITY_DN907_c0_g1_i2:421-1551(-)